MDPYSSGPPMKGSQALPVAQPLWMLSGWLWYLMVTDKVTAVSDADLCPYCVLSTAYQNSTYHRVCQQPEPLWWDFIANVYDVFSKCWNMTWFILWFLCFSWTHNELWSFNIYFDSWMCYLYFKMKTELFTYLDMPLSVRNRRKHYSKYWTFEIPVNSILR